MNQLTKAFRWIALGVLCVVIISYLLFGMRVMRQVNIFTALQEHHGTIRELFKRSEGNREIVSEVRKHLEAHHKSEESVLYDVLKTKEGFRKEVLVTLEEHHLIDVLLAELAKLPKNDERWDARFEVLREYVEHHFEEEEKEIFPKAREFLDDKQMNEMGKRFEKERNVHLWKYRLAS